MAFRIRKPSQESFFALNAIPLYSYAIPLLEIGRGRQDLPWARRFDALHEGLQSGEIEACRQRDRARSP